MSFAQYFKIVRRHWVLITLVTVAGLALSTAYTVTRTPLYTASSQVFVSFRQASSTAELSAGSSYIQRNVASYTNLAKSERVLLPVIEELGLDKTPSELAENITATSPADTVLIDVAATDADPGMAARIANTAATSLSAQVDELETPEGESASPVRLQTVREAAVPTDPSYPNTPLILAMGLLLGLAGGVGVAILKVVVDTRVRTEDDVAALSDSAVIGHIVMDDAAGENPLVVQASPYHARSEAFRRLRTNLQFIDVDGGPQAFVITSSLPDEGKTTTAINLAITLADAESRVLLIDADLRRPTVSKYLGIEDSVGLTTVLINRADWRDVVQPWGSAGLYVLPAGVIPPNPAELVGSRAMSKLLDEVGKEFDHVIIDTPPLLPVTDAALIAKQANGALMVAASGSIRRDQLRQSLGNLTAVNARILGVVLNKVRKDVDGYSYASEYAYYQYGPEQTAAEAPMAVLGRRLRSLVGGAAEPRDAAQGAASTSQAGDLPPRHTVSNKHAKPRWLPTTVRAPETEQAPDPGPAPEEPAADGEPAAVSGPSAAPPVRVRPTP